MTPRPYTHLERQRTVDAGRDRIVAAARDLLQLDQLAAFSLDAVAQRAGVTRMTVYNQFGSKAGLLEELFDLLMERGAFREAPSAFAEKDVTKAFDAFVAIIGRFYTENRPVLARLSAVAGSDPDLDEAMRKRNERRRRGIETLVQRLDGRHRPGVPAEELVHTIDAILGFGTFNAIAGPDRTPSEVVPLMQQVIRGLLGFAKPRRPSPTRPAPAKTARAKAASPKTATPKTATRKTAPPKPRPARGHR